VADGTAGAHVAGQLSFSEPKRLAMLELIILFLGVSLLLYVLMGGADFGAGIIETFSPKQYRSHISRTIGPIWEANHIWIILVVVILFMGFPKVYAQVSLYLHIPLLLMLVGIILRGSSYVFRHYDAVKDGSQAYYGALFRLSSFMTPFFLGTVLGAVMLGHMDTEAVGFVQKFISPWANVFAFSMGLFVTILCGYLAAVYLVGDFSDAAMQQHFAKRARQFMVVLVFAGGLVFLTSEMAGLKMMRHFIWGPMTLAALILATATVPLMWRWLALAKVWPVRILAGIQVLLIMGAWAWHQYPTLVRYSNLDALTFYNAAAPEATLRMLTLALGVGIVLIVPSLVFLYRTFGKREG
jgi:cytochrome bd ubiquinol oxidase subunit II